MKFRNGDIPDGLVVIGSVVRREDDTLGHIVRFAIDAVRHIKVNVAWADQNDIDSEYPEQIDFELDNM